MTPEGKVLSRDLTAALNTSIHFLVQCRPLSAGMGNAIKTLKTQVSNLDMAMPESAAKAAVAELIDNYIQVRPAAAPHYCAAPPSLSDPAQCGSSPLHPLVPAPGCQLTQPPWERRVSWRSGDTA